MRVRVIVEREKKTDSGVDNFFSNPSSTMPVPFEGKKRLYKPKSARDRKDAAFSSEAENLLFQEDGVSLRSDEILYEGRRDIFIYFFFFSLLFFQRFPNENPELSALPRIISTSMSRSLLSPPDRKVSLHQEKAFPQFPRRVADYNASHFSFFFFLLRFAFLIILIRAVF